MEAMVYITRAGEGLRITRPGGGHIMPEGAYNAPLLSRLPEALETPNLGVGRPVSEIFLVQDS